MQPLPYNMTPEAITLIHDGAPRVIKKGTASYTAIRAELFKDEPNWDDVRMMLTRGGAILSWLSGAVDDASLTGFNMDAQGLLSFKGEALPEGFQNRAAQMAAEGKDPRPLLRFFARLQQNPSWRSVQQLYPFLQHQGIPIEEDGTFLAYKGVREDLKDVHSGTIDNSPGQVVKIERNKISDDANTACHFGLHVGAKEYARPFGPRCIVCRVKPENVVCIPYDSSQQKMRVCEYEVVGFDVGVDLPDTTADAGDVPDQDDDYEDGGMDQDDYQTTGEVDLDDGAAPAEPRKSGRSEPKSPRSLAHMDARKLVDETIDSLRAYAKHLKIVGATKLSGGKVALVKVIVKARRSR